MFRKLTLITMAVVLGLAVFAGCSDNGVTGSGNSFSRWDYLVLEGIVCYDGDPYEGALVELLYNGGVVDYDYTNANGFYGIYEIGIPEETKAEWAVRCTVPEPFAPGPVTIPFPRPPHTHWIEIRYLVDSKLKGLNTSNREYLRTKQ